MAEDNQVESRKPESNGIPKFPSNYRFEDNRLSNWSQQNSPSIF